MKRLIEGIIIENMLISEFAGLRTNYQKSEALMDYNERISKATII
jgi:hypothetical protein